MPCYDHAARRASVRRGRERGCWVYVPREELAKTGHPLDGPPPHYKMWAGPRGRLVIQLYKER